MQDSKSPLTARTPEPATLADEPVSARIRHVITGSLWRFGGERGSQDGLGRGEARDWQSVWGGGFYLCPMGLPGGARLRTAKPGRHHRTRDLRPANRHRTLWLRCTRL